MTPPKLTGQAPVLNVFKPLTINTAPFSGLNIDFTGLNGLKTDFTDGFAGEVGRGGSRFAHGHVPLFGQHGFDHFARTGDSRHHVLVILNAHQKSLSFQVLDDRLTSFIAIHAAVFFRDIVIHLGGLG